MAKSVITDRLEEETIRTGSRYRAGAMLAQAGYTLGLAARDRAALSDILGAELLAEVAATVEKLRASVGDREVAGAEAKSKTVAQGESARKALLWRRRALRLGSILKRRGVAGADGLTRITSPDKSLANLRREVEEKASLIASFAAKAPNPEFAKKLAAEGKSLAGALAGADAAQEMDLKGLPAKTRSLYLTIGLTYEGVKQINEAGRMVHSDDAGRAAEYNLEILYRTGRDGSPAAGGGGSAAGASAP